MKKLFIIGSAVSAFLLVGLVPLNMFVIKFPEWVIWIPAAMLAAVNILRIIKSDEKRAVKIIAPIVSAILIAAAWAGAYCNPYWSSTLVRPSDCTKDYDTVLTYSQAQDDMEEMLHWVKKDHPMFMDGCPQGFSAAYDEALARLEKDDEITVNDLYREMQTMLSTLSDGHTTAYVLYNEEHYLRTIAERRAQGYTLDSINGKSITELFEENRGLFSFDAESWGVENLSGKLTSKEGLAFIGIDAEGVSYTWINESGERLTEAYTSADFVTYAEYVKYNEAYMTNESETKSFASYKIDKDKSLAILTLTECNYNDEYIACLRDMFTEVKAQGINNVAVDLRGNGGGDSRVANEFIRYLEVDSYKVDTTEQRLGVFMVSQDDAVMENEKYAELTFLGDVYLLTDATSFSSAMLFAQYIKDNGLGTIIGEPPGNDPNGYGDIATFRLDNSGIYLSVSTKKFLRASGEVIDRLVMPDIECDGDDAMNVLGETIG
ncbi:MAG: hypothetical protein E7546_04820 [Ruminococcaceae bacterium]|nr:hypothetical protein [Oscillospiraceae bacterium]